jgi:hypothetical protein
MNRAKKNRSNRNSSRVHAPESLSEELLRQVSGGLAVALDNGDAGRIMRARTSQERAAIVQDAKKKREAELAKVGNFFKQAFYSTPIGAVVNAIVSRDPKKLIGAVSLVPGVGAGAGAAIKAVAQPAVDGKRGKEYLKNVAVNVATEAVSAVPGGVGRGLGMAANAAAKAGRAGLSTGLEAAAKGVKIANKAHQAYDQVKSPSRK